MNMNGRQFVLVYKLVKPWRNNIWTNRRAVPWSKKSVGILPLIAQPQAFAWLLGAPTTQHGYYVSGNFHTAFGCFVFCFILKHTFACQIERRTENEDQRPFEINIFPFQSAQFTAPPSGIEQQFDNDLILCAFLVECSKQACSLFFIQIGGLLPFVFRKCNTPAGIRKNNLPFHRSAQHGGNEPVVM